MHSKPLPLGIQDSLPKTYLFLNSLCYLLGGEVQFCYTKGKTGTKRALCCIGKLGFYNFHTCWHAEKDSARSCGHLSNKVIKASIIRGSMQAPAGSSGELKGQAVSWDFVNVAGSSQFWILGVLLLLSLFYFFVFLKLVWTNMYIWIQMDLPPLSTQTLGLICIV